MSLPRAELVVRISDRLDELAARLKARSRAGLTDGNQILETIARRFFNALFGWNLMNLNLEESNFAAADLGDRQRRLAFQITNEESGYKISRTAAKAIDHGLGAEFDRLVIFFLLPTKPGFPKKFIQPPDGPTIETWDVADLSKQIQDLDDLNLLVRAAAILGEEMGKIAELVDAPKIDVARIDRYAPERLIGREVELKRLNDAWFGGADLPVSPDIGAAQQRRPAGTKVLTFVALGGEGKTSLVAKWLTDLASQDWPDCEAAFAWSFYSQGQSESGSSDLFLNEAISFFGDEADCQFAGTNASAYEKAKRLARIIGARRCLLMLDGLEPLQYPPSLPMAGELKDQGVSALLKALAANNRGLCVVTTRYPIRDLKNYWETTAPMVDLKRLSKEAGVDLLRRLGVKGTQRELETLVEDVKGHALTLNLLGTYLRDAHGGDIRKRDLVKLQDADAEEQGGHAFRVMDAYVGWLEGPQPSSRGRQSAPSAPVEDQRRLTSAATEEEARGQRSLALLRLMGLFDRPATAECLEAVWRAPIIIGLTEPLVGLSEARRNLAFSWLEAAKLLTVNRDGSGMLVSADAHPLLREYFAMDLKRRSGETAPRAEVAGTLPSVALNTWREAHRRIYEHLCLTTKDKPRPTLEDLQPLYQAVVHGCQAGATEESRANVFLNRIRKGEEAYSAHKLGAFGSDLEAVASFFMKPWSDLLAGISDSGHGWLFNESAFCLRALGRLTESLEPMRAGVKFAAKNGDWWNAATGSSSLSELELELGAVDLAVKAAERSVTYADRSGDPQQRVTRRTSVANILHQVGRRAEAAARFSTAEQMQAEAQPAYPLLYSKRGFLYCDLLLAAPERAAWENSECIQCASLVDGTPGGPRGETVELLEFCSAVSQRAAQTLKWLELRKQPWLLDIALDHLTLGRAALYAAILNGRSELPLRLDIGAAQQRRPTGNDQRGLTSAATELDTAVAGLRRSGQQDHLPRGLLTRSWLRFLIGARTGSESAQEDLDEAWEIAERGPMRLFMADIQLYRARLFFREAHYPWESPATNLAAAEKLIHQCGYHRRDEELADAKRAILAR